MIFKKLNFKKKLNFFDKKSIYFYLIILVIFFIWFSKFPTLRYGGYSIVFLSISIPLALLYKNLVERPSFKKKFTYVIVFIVMVFNIKNITRIQGEINRVDMYKFDNFPFFVIKEKNYISTEFNDGLTMYESTGHCWGSPTPCSGGYDEKIKVKKVNGYYFIYK